MRLFGLILFAAIPIAAHAQKISIEFDDTRDFTDFRTFAIAGGAIHSKNPSLNNEIVQRNIEAEIRRRLTERGFTEVPARPDLNVRYQLGSNRVAEREAYPAGWRGWGTRVVVTHFTEGTLVIDLRDARKHALVWRAIAVEEQRDPLKVKDHLPDMVRKSIEKYPPKK